MSSVNERRTLETEPLRPVDLNAPPPPLSAKASPFFADRKRRRIVTAVLVGLGLLALSGQWLWSRYTHIYVTDARVAADIITLSSEVSGRVVDLSVLEGDTIARGDKLVVIDRAQTEFELAAIDARIAGTGAQQDQLRAQQDLIRIQIERKKDAAEAEIAAAEAAHKSAEARLKRAQSQYDRIATLAGRQIASTKTLDDAREELTMAQQQKLSAAAGVTAATANLASVEAESAQIDVLERQIKALEAQKSAQAADRESKLLDIRHGLITAEFNGVIDRTFVDAGEYVSMGTRLLMYHDPDAVWIEANVKETEFRSLKIGAPVDIRVDAYPGRTFKGKVTRLGGAATSQFALLPSPNPSGNFTKVQQRLPIRISIDQQDGLLRPGMMVEANIDVVH